ncbi:MAG: hypothetical protein ACTH05_07075 [Yaniella sp.]
MRALLSLLLLAIMSSLPLAVLVQNAIQSEVHALTAASRSGPALIWPDDLRVAVPEETLAVLTNLSEDSGVNITRMSVSDQPGGRTQITEYVLNNRDDSTLLTDLSGAKDGIKQSWILSAEDLKTLSQPFANDDVEKVVPFGNGFDLEFRSLKQAFDHLPASGIYYIDARDPEAAAEFFSSVETELEAAGLVDLSLQSHTPTTGEQSLTVPIALKLLPYMLSGFALIIVVSLIFRDGTRIGILRLFGFSTVRIWFISTGRIQVIASCVALGVVLLIGILIPGARPMALLSICVPVIIACSSLLAISAITSTAIIKWTSSTSLLKGFMR